MSESRSDLLSMFLGIDPEQAVPAALGAFLTDVTETRANHFACPFCTLPASRIKADNEHAVLIRDAFPVSPGHSLVIPKRHFGSYFETTDSERAAMQALLVEAKRTVDAEFRPQGYNIGVNDGAAAGQTVPHLHMHLIPRYAGDVADPRGGVRWVIADKADYWSGPKS